MGLSVIHVCTLLRIRAFRPRHLMYFHNSQRNAWLPYFTYLTAIIFLAPLSCFDEMLVEDPKVNRLEDSFQLWTAVVSSKLLAKVSLSYDITSLSAD